MLPDDKIELQKKIDTLNRPYFVVKIKGIVRVGEIGLEGLELMTERDFKLLQANNRHSSSQKDRQIAWRPRCQSEVDPIFETAIGRS